jgi:hypothetical protein
MTHFNLTPRHLTTANEENQEKLQSGELASGLGIEYATSQT